MSQALLLSDSVPSVSVHDGRPATTSLEVAKFFGKRHDHVMRGIKDIIDNCAESFSAPNFGAANTPQAFSAHNFVGASYLDEQAKNRPMYIIYRDGFMLLVMGYTGKKALALKLAYIEAFNRMEAELAKRNRPALPANAGLYRDRIKALDRLEAEWLDFASESRQRARKLERELQAIGEGTFPELLQRACTKRNIVLDSLIQPLTAPRYNAMNLLNDALEEMRYAIRAARTANRLMLG